MSAPEVTTPGASPPKGRLKKLFLEAVRFVSSGALVFPLGLGVAALCRQYLGWGDELATVAAFASLLMINFVLGRAFVFRSAGPFKQELARFMGTAVVMRGFESLFSIALQKLTGLSYLLSITATLCLSSMIKFFLYRTWVFRRATPAAAEDAERRTLL
jgi:putative flippase GtrA